MQEAAKRVINTLGVSDYFSVVQFSNEATILGNDRLMLRATDENKKQMVQWIDGLDADGGTVFFNGFDLAFRTFEESASLDKSSGCHQAILFLSDGLIDDDKNRLLQHIQKERAKYTARNRNPPVIFTYSFGSQADDSVPKEIACSNDGIWAKIGDGEDLAKSMGAYYKYFAYGLGDKVNEAFVAWVEPYEYSTDVGIGITASAPVYDRRVVPAILAGVVGRDISFAALQKAFGNVDEASKNDILKLIIERSGAVCPKFNLTDCQLESLRKYGSEDEGNDNALCGQCSSEIQPLRAPLCPNYASELWNNRLNQGRTFEEKTCCNVGAEPRIAGSLTDEEIKNAAVCTEDSNFFKWFFISIFLFCTLWVVSLHIYVWFVV